MIQILQVIASVLLVLAVYLIADALKKYIRKRKIGNNHSREMMRLLELEKRKAELEEELGIKSVIINLADAVNKLEKVKRERDRTYKRVYVQGEDKNEK